MEVADRQQLGRALGEPFLRGGALTLGAMSVAAACMRPSKSSAYFKARSTFFLNFIAVSLFGLKARFSAPTHMSREPARAGAVKVGRHCGSATSINVSRPYLDNSEHDGTLTVVGMTMSRGARFCSVEDLAPHACIRWTIEVRNHDAWMRIGERSSEAADPFYCAA